MIWRFEMCDNCLWLICMSSFGVSDIGREHSDFDRQNHQTFHTALFVHITLDVVVFLHVTKRSHTVIFL
jgi:hypothetical protein